MSDNIFIARQTPLLVYAHATIQMTNMINIDRLVVL